MENVSSIWERGLLSHNAVQEAGLVVKNMLWCRQSIQNEIVILYLDRDLLVQSRTIFTDDNAASKRTKALATEIFTRLVSTRGCSLTDPIIITGNIFTSQCQTMVNTVNCVGVMGAGIALEFKLRLPEMFDQYIHHCRAGLIDIGNLWLYKPPADAREWR